MQIFFKRFFLNCLLIWCLEEYAFVHCLRTAVPDEIIGILNDHYNKHHLPTHVSPKMSNYFCKDMSDISQKIFKKRDEYLIRSSSKLIVEYRKQLEEQMIRFIKIDNKTDRRTRVTLSLRAASEVVKNMELILAKYKSLYKSTVTTKTAGSVTAPEGPVTIVGYETHIDPIRRHTVDLVRNGDSLELHITEIKAPSRRQFVIVPGEFIQNVTRSVKELLKYRRREPEVVGATDLKIGMYIEGMSSFRAQSMDFHLDIYFNQQWTDRRLVHTNEHVILVKDSNIFNKMWQPDLYFANAKDATYHTVTAPNYFLWIYPNGTVYMDVRITLVVNCMMDLKEYPLDTQECYVRILSYAYDIDNLNIFWRPDDPITINCEIKLADMQLVAYGAKYCDGNYSIGQWACALASFKMKRYKMHHVLQSYVPTALIVIISWFSFWLDVDAVPGRVSLCITTLLTLATQSQAAKMSLPQVSYAKAIDIWMGVCMAFVFGVMIEFTAVNYLSRQVSSSKTAPDPSGNGRRGKKLTMRPMPEFRNLLFDNHRECDASSSNQRDASTNCVTPAVVLNSDGVVPSKGIGRKRAVMVDRISRIGFPISFAFFNLCYWLIYMTVVKTYKSDITHIDCKE